MFYHPYVHIHNHGCFTSLQTDAHIHNHECITSLQTDAHIHNHGSFTSLQTDTHGFYNTQGLTNSTHGRFLSEL